MVNAPHHRAVNEKLRRNARALRREMTDAERALWRLLRDRRLGDVKFRQQETFGPFSLDLVCFERKLVIEVDGGQHTKSRRDAERDTHPAAKGFRIVRYWNNDVLKNREGVLTDLAHRLRLGWDPSPGPSLRSGPPSPTGGEG